MYGLRLIVGLELALWGLGYGWLFGGQDWRVYGSEISQGGASVEINEDSL